MLTFTTHETFPCFAVPNALLKGKGDWAFRSQPIMICMTDARDLHLHVDLIVLISSSPSALHDVMAKIEMLYVPMPQFLRVTDLIVFHC